jgi:hypothetical protein
VVLAKARTVHVKGHVTHDLPRRQGVSVMLTGGNGGGMIMGPVRKTGCHAAHEQRSRATLPDRKKGFE